MEASLSDLTMREGYWHDARAKAAFCRLIRDTFGLDFSAWDTAGYWDDRYCPFTWFDRDGEAVSSVCLYTMNLVVDGRRQVAGQLSAVATRPVWRRRGLAQRLAEEALQRSAGQGHAFQYLFSDDEARSFYRRLGFVAVEEQVTAIDLIGRDPLPGARRLDPAHAVDLALIHRLARERAPVSGKLGVLNDRLVMFYALGPLRDAPWHVEPLDVVVLGSRNAGVLTIFDVIGRRIPALAELYPFLADRLDVRIVVRFEPDQLGDLHALGCVGVQPLTGNNLHVRSDFPLRGPVVFPLTAQA